ncbi:MAG: hypothetical protein ACRDA4_06590 [Filifactoraceae bacterium]
MKNKVSIREVVATKIIFGILIAGYYWMWSRSDWRPEYRQLQSNWGFLIVGILLIHYYRVEKYKKECFDELAEKNLHRCDAICLKVFVVLMVIIAYLGGILGHANMVSSTLMGWLILGAVNVIAILRTIIFFVIDKKGV